MPVAAVKKATPRKRSDPRWIRFLIDRDTHSRLKAFAAHEDQPMQAVIVDIVRAGLDVKAKVPSTS